MISTSDFKEGMAIIVDGQIYKILSFQHVSPGNWRAFVRTKLRNLATGAVVDRNFRAGEKFEQAVLENAPVQFLYKDGNTYHFMNTETFDQLAVDAEVLGDATKYLTEQMEVTVRLHEGRVVEVQVPPHVDLLVVETDPGLKGDTATAATKPAKLETGAVIQVPLFVQKGERVRVDTRTGEYVTRVSD